jgi:hypothetical protein
VTGIEVGQGIPAKEINGFAREPAASLSENAITSRLG